MDEPKLAKLDATLEPGIVSERCMLLLKCVDSSKVALRWPLNKIGLSVYIELLFAPALACSPAGSLVFAGVVWSCSSSFKAPSGSFCVTGVRGDIL